ncbi:MAG TPA: arylsulfatase [Acidimicrobiales bacterium]|nr:arylsulfatase [Acidimicrobiales bacterium]
MADEAPAGSGRRRTYPGFGGTVGRTFAGSEPWWPERPDPTGRPNVVVILADDLGYSDLGCYGSEIRTPHLDALAAGGLRFTDYHATPMCSPTRASLLTGLNPHAAGVGTVAHSDPGFPGYAMEIAADVATAAEIYRDAGWFTAMVGKWHLAKDSDAHDAGPRRSWPCQRGFDRYYGFLDGFTNLHHPHRLVEDNHAVEVDRYPDGYYFTDDITDRAVAMLTAAKASDPTKPFFLYVAHGAVHAPLHAKPDDIARYRGRYDRGWDVLRQERFARLVELGILAPGTVLPPRNAEAGHDVAPWDELSDPQRRLAARYMEIYAAMVDNVDQSTGRLMSALEAMGERDNTIVVFTSDNGASREGEVDGTASYYVHLMAETDLATDLARIDDMGGPTTTPHYPRGWAMAGNTPFRLYKINAHAGGHQVPLIVHGPVPGRAGELRHQYQYVTDVLPTLLELCGVAHPSAAGRGGARPVHGTSFVPVLADAGHPSTHPEQYTEMIGHRGYRRGGWEAVTLHQPLTPFDDGEWELYDVAADPTQVADRAGERPEVLADLRARWEEAAWENRVYPLDEGTALKYLLRPPRQAAYEQPVTLLPGTPTLERWRSLQLLFLRSVAVTIRVTVGPGDEGILVAHGDQGGGYAVWLDPEGLHVAHNDGCGTLRGIDAPRPAPGPREVVLRLDAPGGAVWHASLAVDGAVVGEGAEPWPCLYAMAPFEGIDVGIDRRSPVVWRLYQAHGPYPYTGALTSVTYQPGDRPPDAPAHLLPVLREMGLRYE